MAFTPKQWKDEPNTATPIDADALIDLETRLAAYADTRPGPQGPAGPSGGLATVFTEPGDTAPDASAYQQDDIWMEILE